MKPAHTLKSLATLAVLRRLAVWTILSSVTIILAACAGTRRQGEPASHLPRSPWGGESMFTAPVELRLDAPADVVAGRDVELSVVVHNTSASAVEVEVAAFPRPVGFDVVVYDVRNRVVWRRVRGVVPAAALGITIEPSSPLRLSCIWNGRDLSGKPVPPGVYHLQAMLTDVTSGPPRELVTAPQTLRVTPG